MLEPLEIYKEHVYEILDPNTAQLVAIFYDAAAAFAYAKWRNEAMQLANQTSAAQIRPADANTFCAADSTSPPNDHRPDSQQKPRGETTSSADQSPCAEEAKQETPAEEQA